MLCQPSIDFGPTKLDHAAHLHERYLVARRPLVYPISGDTAQVFCQFGHTHQAIRLFGYLQVAHHRLEHRRYFLGNSRDGLRRNCKFKIQVGSPVGELGNGLPSPLIADPGATYGLLDAMRQRFSAFTEYPSKFIIRHGLLFPGDLLRTPAS